MIRLSALFLICLLAAPAYSGGAAWQLNAEQSTLHFITTKAINVSEIHQFRKLNGSVDSAGKASVEIDLSSVDTAIPIRDERMQKLLFETDRFPAANFSAQVPIEKLAQFKPGESQVLQLKGELGLHGMTVPVQAAAKVTRLADKSLQVDSLGPVLVSASDVGLVQGIEKLREIAGLPSIGQSVAITFNLNFRQ